MAHSCNSRAHGNGPDRYDLRMASVTDASGVEVQWDVTVPRDKLFELSYDNLTTPKSQTVDVIMKVPKQVQAGQYTLKLNAFSEELYEGTRLRDTVTVVVIVNEFYDMQISIDESQDNPLKITAPGRIVKYVVNVTNLEMFQIRQDFTTTRKSKIRHLVN